MRSLVTSRLSKFHLLPILLILLIAIPFIARSPFILHILILMFLFIALGEAWNLIGGYAGQLSLGHAAFFGLGAYTSFLLHVRYGTSPWLGMFLGGLVAVVFALLIGAICFRLRGPYFALATIALAEVLRLVVVNWSSVTQGAEGIVVSKVPTLTIPNLFTVQFGSKLPYYYLILLISSAIVFSTYKIANSKVGFFLLAIKNNQDASESLGVDTTRYKLIALIISAFFTGILGAFYAFFVLFIDPESVLEISLSIKIVLVALIGGTATVIGPVVGGALIVLLSETLRGYFATAHLLIYGSLVILVVLFMPDGLVGALSSLRKRIARRNSLVSV